MTLLSIFLIALAVSFDSMAVSASSGACNNKLSFLKSLRIAFFFGLFQGLMPLIGFVLGSGLEKFISGLDHWVAFGLLGVLGFKMIIESFKHEKEKEIDINKLKILVLLAIATSIDALVVGMTLALLPVNIWLAVSVISITTFSLSLISVYFGKMCGKKWGKIAEVIGGLILIIIGFKILFDHLFA